MNSRADTVLRPNALAQQRLSSTFWGLARGSGLETQSRDPEAVVRHLLAVVHSLQGTRHRSDISADSLSFLLHLEHDRYYASPEQTRGGEKDSQSLVYSIGVLLFERLTGHHPFVESLSPLHCAVVRDRSQRLGPNHIASIPSQLRAILHTAMSPFADDRWDNVTQLRRELEGFLGRAETVLAPLPTRRAGSRPAPSRAVTKQLDRELPALVESRRKASTSDGAPRQVFADGSGPHGGPHNRQRARRATPPPCPGSTERAQSHSYAEMQIERADSHAESPELSDSISRLVNIEFPTVDAAAASKTNRFVIASLATVLVTIVVTVGLLVLSETRATAFAPAVTLRAPATATAAPTTTEPTTTEPTTTEPTTTSSPAVATGQTTTATGITATPLVAKASLTSTKPRVPSTFDIRYAGANALSAARTCFGEARLRRSLMVGATLLFSSKTGRSSKVFLATKMPVTSSQRACLQRKLHGISAGAAPRRGAMVTYTLFLTADGGRAHGRHRK